MKTTQLTPFLLRYAMHGLGDLGLLFIAYGVVSTVTDQKWQPVEQIAPQLSAALTIFATLLTAASVYHASMNTPPERISKFATAPVVIAICTFALASLFWRRLDPVIVNGFAMLGMAGAMMRIQPNPHYPAGSHPGFDKQRHVNILVQHIIGYHSEYVEDCVRALNEHRDKSAADWIKLSTS